jgi:dTDP-L-rhamnose 4-epimerase
MILVTGGAGFIGSHIVDLLISEGHEVRVLDVLLGTAHGDVVPELNPEAELIHGDVTDAATVARALRGVDVVCHQAAMVGLGANIHDLPAYVHHNDLGTAILLGEMARAGFGGRLVLASSMVVYGEGRYLCDEHGQVMPPPRELASLARGSFEVQCPHCGRPLTPDAVPESAQTDPRNVYAATKLHQEHLCSSFSRELGVPVAALRYHNVYGPRMPRDTPYAGVAAIFRSALEAGRAPNVFEDGGQLRDFVHVRDVARANLLAITAAEPLSGPVNVASGKPRSVLEMAAALAEAIPAAPAPQVTGEFRPGDVRHVFASTVSARERLGFVAGEDFMAGMTEFATAPLRA